MKTYNFKIFLLILSVFVFPSVFGIQAKKCGDSQRKYLISVMTKIADPVLNSLSKGQLKMKMPVEAKSETFNNPHEVTHLEAFARLIGGMAPWLELGNDYSQEAKLREKYIQLALICIRNSTDSLSSDYLNFSKGNQPLVDAAFLAQAFLRAPTQLWGRLDNSTKENVIKALKSTRIIKPYNNNWLLFSAMIETALYRFDGNFDKNVVDNAVSKMLEWYKGDGVYGDGESFHFDYYNSFVIQPMLIDILFTFKDRSVTDKQKYDLVFKRAQRYAVIQERLISPEGSFPPVGRSIAYRFGAFQLLSQIALKEALPASITPQQVRCALYTVIKKQIVGKGTYDKNGWLTIGFCGHQPNIGENYISTGSVYLCSQAFLMLGLPADNQFWKGENKDWTAKKAWSGKDFPIDKSEN